MTESNEPLVKPRLPRLLKERPKLVGGSFRDEFWEQVESNVAQRRTPEEVADRGVRKGLNEAAEAAAPVTKNRVKSAAEKANNSVLNNI